MRKLFDKQRESEKLPIIPPPYIPQKFPSFGANSCSKCGLKCEGVMGYCCPNYDCPMGMGGTWCLSTASHTR